MSTNITLRDWYKGQAIIGLIPVFNRLDKSIVRESGFETLAAFIANEAGVIADACINENNKLLTKEKSHE